jgi:hypothetical protein
MSKTITFRGSLGIGLQKKLKLSTIQGKVGYQITNFVILPERPGQDNPELIAKVFSKDQTGSITDQIDFGDSNLLAVALFHGSADSDPFGNTTIFDNEIVNQDVYITVEDASGDTRPGQFYIEFKTVALTDIQSTQLTLKNLRTIASR